MMGMFETNLVVKETLKVTFEHRIGKKQVHPLPVGWDGDEQGLLRGRQCSSPIALTSTETWLMLQIYMATYIRIYREKAV